MVAPPNPSLYFAYGANLNKAHMQRCCPQAEAVEAAWLPGYALTFRHYADIIPHKTEEAAVPGALWRIPEGAVEALDAYEDYPTAYSKKTLAVRTACGHLVQAWGYVMRYTHLAPPSPRYLRKIAAGYADWGLPVACLKESVVHVETVAAKNRPSVAALLDSAA